MSWDKSSAIVGNCLKVASRHLYEAEGSTNRQQHCIQELVAYWRVALNVWQDEVQHRSGFLLSSYGVMRPIAYLQP